MWQNLVGTGFIQVFDLKVGCNYINILAPLCKQLVDSEQRSGIVGISRNLFHEKSWLSRAHRLFFNQSFLCRTDWTFALPFIEQYYISCYGIIFWLIYDLCRFVPIHYKTSNKLKNTFSTSRLSIWKTDVLIITYNVQMFLLKVIKNQNDFMKTSFLPKSNEILRII